MQPEQQPKTAAPESPTAPAKKKRFRIEKLEERIAPKRKGGGNSSASSGFSIGASIY